MIKLNIVYILKEEKALELKSLGFLYSTKLIDNHTVYEFIGTPELLSIVNGKFNAQEFFVSKTMNY